MGNASALDASYPVAVNDAQGLPLADVKAVAAAGNHSFALRNDGSLLAWGDNDFGELGVSNTDQHPVPVLVTDGLGQPLLGISAIALGINHTLALKNDGTLLAWGSNSYGQLGIALFEDQSSPAVVDAEGLLVTGVQAIGAGWLHSVAIKNDGSLWLWGNNGHGQLGDDQSVTHANPMLAKDAQGQPLSNLLQAAGGGDHTVILKQDGTVQSWGDNSFGQLGDGSTIAQTQPVAVLDENNLPVIDAQTVPIP